MDKLIQFLEEQKEYGRTTVLLEIDEVLRMARQIRAAERKTVSLGNPDE